MYRKWNATNGGGYGSISATIPPNPYLKIKERDVSTLSGGCQLTLINPAYMTRQVHELEKKKNGVVDITSLNSIRPANRADEWETRTLKKVEQGVVEVDKGTSQGLAIGHDITTQKHNSSLEVVSEEGRGTTFIIHLLTDDKEPTNSII